MTENKNDACSYSQNDNPEDNAPINASLQENVAKLHKLLPLGKSFDLMTRDLLLGETKAFWIGLNGFCVSELLEKMFGALQGTEGEQANLPQLSASGQGSNAPADNDNSLHAFIEARVGIAQISYAFDFTVVLDKLTSGNSVLFVDGFAQAVILDTRAYHSRSVDEPELEKMTRGARDGFIEILLTNANLIRRRIRSPHLVFEMHEVGEIGKTDVCVAYLEDRCDPELVRKISQKIDELKITALTMGAKSLEELLVKRRFFNPLPSLQMTERPDVAASYLAEGYVLVLVDNTPMALVLPCTIFHFTQTAEDYYKNPLVGTYLRFIRFLCMPVALLFLPLFLLITAYYPQLAEKLQLISTEIPSKGRLFFYVLVVEFFLAMFQYSASLSSDRFSGALSIVGGLLIGDIAVSLHWSTSEVLFYGGITLLATISVSCVELSDALRLYRMFLLLCTFFAGVPGFWIGLGLVLLSILTTPTFGGYSYFWPLIPWNGKALVNLILRTPTAKAQPSKVWKR
ncbi:MAG: spore germination protein [Lachnospiraceae bacterium]|nr:spore germination protein [Lachnospiraceae bacterium]